MKKMWWLGVSCIIVLLSCTNKKAGTKKEEVVIRIASYNIHHCNPPAEEASGKIDIAAVATAISKLEADIIALQEVDVKTKRSGGVDQAKELASKLNMYVVFGKAIDYEGGEYGLAILSKYPLSEVRVHKLPSDADTAAEPRILLTAVALLPQKKQVLIGNTHLDVLAAGNREMQAKAITAVARKQVLPMILAGDWNDNPGSATVNILDKVFTRTCNNCAITCPEDGEKGVIDFIAYTTITAARVLHYEVIKSSVSDHYPLIADIGILYPER